MGSLFLDFELFIHRGIASTKPLLLAGFILSSPVHSANESGKKVPGTPAQNAQGLISLPPIPMMKTPTQESDADLDQDIAKKKALRESREKPREDIRQSNRVPKKLIEEALKEHAYLSYAEWSLVLPKIQTQGPRESYEADYLASHLQWIWFGHGEDPYTPHWIYGVRIASFSGSGRYDKIPGRFSFLYFGPAFGFGQIHRKFAEKDPVAKTAEEKARDSVVIMQRGWTLLGGLALQSRRGRSDATTPEPAKDLNTRALDLDGVGAWVEASYFFLFYGTLGLHTKLGMQIGEGKNFIWIGIGSSGWF